MSEAVNEVASLEDVEAETFVRFIQWAYTGSYHVGRDNNNNNNSNNSNNSNNNSNSNSLNNDDMRESATDEAVLCEPYEETVWRPGLPPIMKEVEGKKWLKKKGGYGDHYFSPRPQTEPLRRAFSGRDYPVFESSLTPSNPFYYNNSNNSNNNSTNNININNNNNRALGLDNQPKAFLLHAKIFVFAEKYDLQALKMLSIRNLHYSLSHHQLFIQHIPDIVNLIRYSYDNTQASSDTLRELLASYVELEMAMIIEAKSFEELLEEGGEFVADFLKKVKNRIS